MSDKDKDKEILDADADGLTDEEEKELGTDPENPDSDYDALADYQEVNVYKTNPLDSDTDKDGVEDGIEVMLGRNPRGTGILADFFIPSARNNYRPKALRPHRLIFHALTAIVIKVVMVGFLLSFPIQAWLSPDILYEQSQKIIQLTNNLRQTLSLGQLQENSLLNRAALNKAEDMLINEYFAHLSPDNKSLKTWLLESGYAFKVAGENLAIGFPDANTVFEAWKKSPTHYANIIDPEFTEIGVGAVNGTYKGYETTLVAQYFGQPKVNTAVVTTPEPEPTPEPIPTPVPEKPQPELPVVPPQNNQVVTPPVIPPVSEPEPTPEPIPTPTPEPTDVLGEQEQIEPLQAPILLDPAEKYISKEDIVNLEISAPGADRVAVLADDELILSKEIEKSEFITVAVTLAEGSYNINLVSYRGSESAVSSTYNLVIDKTPPILDEKSTYILVNKPIGQEDVVVKASAYLSNDTSEATVAFNNYSIALSPDFSEPNKWSGSTIIDDANYQELFNPIVLPALIAKDEAGNTLTQDIDWRDITPVKNSAIKQYLFVKNNPSEYIKPLLDVSSIYFRILLALAIIALLLNIFIEFKKQHPHTIVSTLGLIILISFLTIF
ncbi:CAP domain-containing protein [Candidatus Parcubacteria bacterium]|nr:MAG: CAP domain-containing protein [Candidatus Parcubacteria bacterium]